MTLTFSGDKPIYVQIIDIVLTRILNGEYPASSKIPTVRDLAAELQVNPNTLQRAFSELEKMQIINVQRTNGRFVTSNTQLIEELKEKQAFILTDTYLSDVKKLGYDKKDAIELINNNKEDE